MSAKSWLLDLLDDSSFSNWWCCAFLSLLCWSLNISAQYSESEHWTCSLHVGSSCHAVGASYLFGQLVGKWVWVLCWHYWGRTRYSDHLSWPSSPRVNTSCLAFESSCYICPLPLVLPWSQYLALFTCSGLMWLCVFVPNLEEKCWFGACGAAGREAIPGGCSGSGSQGHFAWWSLQPVTVTCGFAVLENKYHSQKLLWVSPLRLLWMGRGWVWTDRPRPGIVALAGPAFVRWEPGVRGALLPCGLGRVVWPEFTFPWNPTRPGDVSEGNLFFQLWWPGTASMPSKLGTYRGVETFLISTFLDCQWDVCCFRSPACPSLLTLF